MRKLNQFLFLILCLTSCSESISEMEGMDQRNVSSKEELPLASDTMVFLKNGISVNWTNEWGDFVYDSVFHSISQDSLIEKLIPVLRDTNKLTRLKLPGGRRGVSKAVISALLIMKKYSITPKEAINQKHETWLNGYPVFLKRISTQ